MSEYPLHWKGQIKKFRMMSRDTVTFSTCTLVRKGTQVDEMIALSGMVTSLQVAGIDEPTSLRYICGKHLQPFDSNDGQQSKRSKSMLESPIMMKGNGTKSTKQQMHQN